MNCKINLHTNIYKENKKIDKNKCTKFLKCKYTYIAFNI